MRKLLLILALVSSTAHADPMLIPADIFACADNTDCKIMDNACGWTAVNKMKSLEAQKLFNDEKSKTKCTPSGEKPEAAFCNNHKCEIDTTTENK